MKAEHFIQLCTVSLAPKIMSGTQYVLSKYSLKNE